MLNQAVLLAGAGAGAAGMWVTRRLHRGYIESLAERLRKQQEEEERIRALEEAEAEHSDDDGGALQAAGQGQTTRIPDEQLAELAAGGSYTQTPGSNALAARFCNLASPWQLDGDRPAAGSAVTF